MTLKAFSDNFKDNSTEAGFHFTFFCDLCQEGFKTQFIESKTHKKKNKMRVFSRMVSIGSSLAGKGHHGHMVERGSDVLSERFHGMSPAWHKEHEHAFEIAQNEAKHHFHRCPKCKKWVCEHDWNEQEGLCVDDAPRVNVEVAAAKAQKAVADIRNKASQTEVFTGDIESKQTLCPQCGKPAGEGKFCNNCGGSLQMIICEKCGATHPAGTRFCGECGNKMD